MTTNKFHRRRIFLVMTGICVGLMSCTTSGVKSSTKASKRAAKHQAPFFDQNALGLSRNNVTSNVPYSPPTPDMAANQKLAPAQKPIPKLTLPITARSPLREQCQAAVNRWLPPWREVYPRFKIEDRSALPVEAQKALSSKENPSCESADDRTNVIKALAPLISQHKNRIAVIAPLSGPHAAVGKSLVAGFQAALTERRVNVETRVILVDSEEWNNAAAMTQAKTRIDKLDQQLVSALIKEGATMVVAAVDVLAEQHLISRARSLDFPLLLLASGAADADLRDTPAFRVIPNISTMANSLAAAALDRGYKKIIIFKPSDGRAEAITAAFVQAFVTRGGSISHMGSFTSGSFESMDSVVQQAFKINASDRKEEQELLFQQMKQAAADRKESFNPKTVILPPVIDGDAVFLPDDFRTVRHFAKILRYHGVKSMPLLGHQGWRSQGLLEPYDRYLNNSLFVDYVGSYGQLPLALNAAAYIDPVNSWFIDPQFASTLDLQLIGYRAGTLAIPVLASPMVKRRKVADLLRKTPNKQAGYFAAPKNFDEQQRSVWPAFVFSVTEGTLNIMATPILPPPLTTQQISGAETKAAEQQVH